jgi:hypothetical protein
MSRELIHLKCCEEDTVAKNTVNENRSGEVLDNPGLQSLGVDPTAVHSAALALGEACEEVAVATHMATQKFPHLFGGAVPGRILANAVDHHVEKRGFRRANLSGSQKCWTYDGTLGMYKLTQQTRGSSFDPLNNNLSHVIGNFQLVYDVRCSSSESGIVHLWVAKVASCVRCGNSNNFHVTYDWVYGAPIPAPAQVRNLTKADIRRILGA